MNVERYVRLVAGSIVLISVLLGVYVSPWFFLLTGFVALNLIQSAFTNACPLISILRSAGVREASKAA